MSFFPGGTSNFANDPSVPTGDGTIDLANVQGLKVVDGKISVFNNTSSKTVSSIDLAAGPELNPAGTAAASPACSLTCSKIAGVNPSIFLSRINFVNNKGPVDILSIRESSSLSIVNNVYVTGLLMPSVFGVSRIPPQTYVSDYTAPYYLYLRTFLNVTNTITLRLKTMPPLGNTFCTFCDINPSTAGLTQTFNITSGDGATTYVTITTTGSTRVDIVGIYPDSGDQGILFDVLYTPLSAAETFVVPLADANKMKENAEKVRKGDIMPSEL
jgi:hypothetical protein